MAYTYTNSELFILIIGIGISSVLASAVSFQYASHMLKWRQYLGRCHSVESVLNVSDQVNNKKMIRHLLFYFCLLVGVAVDIPFLAISLSKQNLRSSAQYWRLMSHLQLCCLLIPMQLTIRDWTNILHDPKARWFTPSVLRHAMLRGWLFFYLVFSLGCLAVVVVSIVPGAPDIVAFFLNGWARSLGLVLREGASGLICAALLHAGWCLRSRILSLESQISDVDLKRIRCRLTVIMVVCTVFLLAQAVFFLLDGMMINIFYWNDTVLGSPWVVWLPVVSWLPSLSIVSTMLFLSRPPHEDMEEQRQKSCDDPHSYTLLEDEECFEDNEQNVKFVRQLSGGSRFNFGNIPSNACQPVQTPDSTEEFFKE